MKDKEKVFQCLIKREQSITTGIGYGLAIPHCICPEVNKMTCAAALIPEGLDFEAYDEEPVYFVFMTIANPGEQKTPYCKSSEIIKNISKMMFCVKLSMMLMMKMKFLHFLENNWE